MRRRLLLALTLVLSTPAPALAAAPPPHKLALSEAIALVLARNPQVVAADLADRKASIGVQGAQAERVAISASANGSQLYQSNGLLATSAAAPAGSNALTTNGTLGVTVPLFTGYKITGDVQAAQARAAQAGAQARATRADLVLAATTDYWEVVRARLQEAIEREAAAQAQRTWDLARSRQAVGNAAAFDVDRAEAQAIVEQGRLIAQQGAAAKAVEELAALMHEEPDQVDVQDAPSAIATAEVDAPALFARARDRRPELVQAREHVREAEGGLASARSGWWPQLALVGQTQYGNNPFSPTSQSYGLLSSFQGEADARVQLSMNVLDNGVTRRQVAGADLDVAIARARYDDLLRQVRKQVDEAAIDTSNAARRLAIARRATELSTRALAMVEQRYKLGYALLVEVDAARNSVVAASGGQAQAAIDYLEATAALDHAVGGPQ